MPVYIDYEENEILGPIIRKRKEEGRQEGRQEGELAILRRQLEKRFGPMPDWATAKLATQSSAELEELSERVLDAPNLEDLLK